MVEGDTLQLHFEQLVHRQLAPRVGEAHDDAVDSVALHDGRDVFDSADDFDAVGWTPIASRRIGVDETDDLHAERLPALHDFVLELDGRVADADEKQALPRPHAIGEPLEGDAPSGHERGDERGGKEKHAPADHRGREPEIHRRQHERRTAQRLDDAHEQLFAIRDSLEVVQIGVIEAQLADRGDQYRLDHAVFLLHHHPHPPAKTHVGRQPHGGHDEDAFRSDQQKRAARDPSHLEIPEVSVIISLPGRYPRRRFFRVTSWVYS